MSQAKRCIHRGRQSAVAASIFLLVGCNRDPSSPIGVTAVRLETAQVSLESCEVKTLVADIVAAARTNTALTWESSDPTVAAVDELGVVTAYAHGTATLTVVSVADPRRFAQATVHVHERPAWMELVRVEDAATHARITPLILRDSVDVVAHYSPSGCRASGVVPDVLTLVVVTTTSTDLSARGWQRTAPTS
jgi:uncharacterized protein YjdB